MSEYIPFPTKTLPPVLSKFVAETAAAMRIDEAYMALPLLVTCASAIGNSRCILLKRGWTEPAILWGALVANSGTLKSPAIDKATQPVRRRQQRLFKEHAAAVAEFKQSMKDWKLTKVDRGDEPEAPASMEHAYCSDITVEALADRLEKSCRGVLVSVDELAGWFGSFNQYKSSGADVAHWLSIFGSRALKVDRKTGDRTTIYVPHPAVSIVGGIQPKILRRALTNEFFDNGLAARLLLAMPPVTEKQWSEDEVSDAAENGLQELFGNLYDFKGDTDVEGDPVPALVRMDDAAKAAWIKFYSQHAAEEHAIDGDDLRAAWSKLEGYAARLALVHHCARQASGEAVDPWKIDVESILAGVELSRWFGNETRRVYAEMGATEEDKGRADLVTWIQQHGGDLSERELSRGPRKYREPGAATAALRDLEEAGLGEWWYPPQPDTGRQPEARFRLAATGGAA